MRHTIIRTPIRRNYDDSHGRETLAANLDKETGQQWPDENRTVI